MWNIARGWFTRWGPFERTKLLLKKILRFFQTEDTNMSWINCKLHCKSLLKRKIYIEITLLFEILTRNATIRYEKIIWSTGKIKQKKAESEKNWDVNELYIRSWGIDTPTHKSMNTTVWRDEITSGDFFKLNISLIIKVRFEAVWREKRSKRHMFRQSQYGLCFT